MTETILVPSYIMLSLAFAVMLFASGAVWNLSDRFQRTRWVMRNPLTDDIWITSHRFTKGELRRMAKQRQWNAQVVE
jgi:hypothetical protein